MRFARGIFLMAIGTLVIGFLVGRSLIGPLFSSDAGSGASVAAQLSDTPTATPVRVAAPATAAPTARPTSTPATRLTTRLTRRRTPTPRPSVTPTASPKPTPTPGTVTLDRYWIATQRARRGRTVEIGYVIDNGTGQVARVMLGVSLKTNRALDWATQSISDPAHDVVATVPVGINTHYRFFSLPDSLRPGMYDVAWGLRDAASGRRDALVFAPAVLRVTR